MRVLDAFLFTYNRYTRKAIFIIIVVVVIIIIIIIIFIAVILRLTKHVNKQTNIKLSLHELIVTVGDKKIARNMSCISWDWLLAGANCCFPSSKLLPSVAAAAFRMWRSRISCATVLLCFMLMLAQLNCSEYKLLEEWDKGRERESYECKKKEKEKDVLWKMRNNELWGGKWEGESKIKWRC